MAGQATAISQIEGTARWGLIGDPTTAAGAGMVSLGRLTRVTRTPRMFRQQTKNEVDQVLSVFGNFSGFTIEVEMQRNGFSLLAAMVDDITDGTTILKFGTAMQELEGATLCLVTDEVKANGTPLTDVTTEWYPKVVSTNLGAIANQIVNGDDKPTYTVTFEVMYAAVDQDGQTITPGCELGFKGTPVGAITETTPTAWSLPNVSTW